jgi:hypothetical protein
VIGPSRRDPAAARIRGGLRVAAGLVARHGAEFLPVFTFLEAEAARLDRIEAAIDRATQIAGAA